MRCFFCHKRRNLKFLVVFLAVLGCAFCFGQETLPVYKKVNHEVDEANPIGELSKSDWIKELPLPPDSIKHVREEKSRREVVGKNGKKKIQKVTKRYISWEVRKSKNPPRFVPIECKLGKKVYVKRAELARFQQEAKDLSGEYASATGSVFLRKSPNNPKRFDVIIQNGPATERSEIEMGNLEIHESNGHARLSYHEEGCNVEIAVFNRQVKVAQRGCYEYNIGKYKLEGEYPTYKGNTRKTEVFNMPEQQFKFKKYLWCGSGFDSCEKVKDDNGVVTITWSKDGNGFVERQAGEVVHTYRPFEHMIPHKRDYYKGEKPYVIKTKRTDMSGEWMIWYFYPKAERLKMVRAGMREDIAYMEIYE